MANLEVKIEYIEMRAVYGVWQRASDKTVWKDIRTLSERYHSILSSAKDTVLPYFVLSKNYDRANKSFEMFIGGYIVHNGLEKYILPEGEYAKITVVPKMGFLWGVSIGEAKRYFYTKWLLESPYEALNMDYEYHTEKTIGNHPAMDIIFAIGRKP